MDHDARQAAETLLQSNSLPNHPQLPSNEISHSYSINTISSLHPDYIISEDLLAGERAHGRMSNVRRFFCLFVTFDLLFTGLMWLICLVLRGENIMKALSEQIYHYNIHTSLFDIVLAAICRFTVLILFYALIYINHWIVIAISTTLTCLFLISKVFVYDFPSSTQPVFDVLVIITSFILSWGEAWFLDFRVLPQESNARRYLITDRHSERAPLIQSYVNHLPSIYTESIANFHSPMETPEGSTYHFHTGPMMERYPSVSLTIAQTELYKKTAAKAMTDAWDLLHAEGWKFDSANGGDTVEVLKQKNGKLFRLTAFVDTTPKYLLDELYYKVERIPDWNPSLLESHKVQVIDENTDISYQISADGAGGAVRSRDFVNLRHWDRIDDGFMVVAIATEHPSLPKSTKYLRGENGAGCWVMKEDPNNSNRTILQWLLNTNLNGWIPTFITDKALPQMMLEYVKYLRNHIDTLGALGEV